MQILHFVIFRARVHARERGSVVVNLLMKHSALGTAVPSSYSPTFCAAKLQNGDQVRPDENADAEFYVFGAANRMSAGGSIGPRDTRHIPVYDSRITVVYRCRC